jgi:hypothetical protein
VGYAGYAGHDGRTRAGYEGSDAPTRGSAGVRPVRRPCTDALLPVNLTMDVYLQYCLQDDVDLLTRLMTKSK